MKLSPYQQKIGQLLAIGFSNREIAEELRTTEQAVKSALHVIFDKTGCWNRVELARRMLSDVSPAIGRQSLQRIESERVAELRQRKILDSTAEQAFDEITKMMASLFEVPIALVAFIDSSRVWFKSNIGLKVSEVPRELSICHHTIQQSEVLVVANAPQDPRFVCNPLVQEFGVRFYAAAPILTDDGYPLGVVCIVDHVPREFSANQLSVLKSLARMASQHLDLSRELLNVKQTGKGVGDTAGEPVFVGHCWVDGSGQGNLEEARNP